ncbi:MAG TPA: isoprenylcysteine carboxylmethyltransferase family protein [Stellaceae bacterium]|nr:isoprenylcysteine carboxylmethyltransferase family protein [Stellaceae bacterium]
MSPVGIAVTLVAAQRLGELALSQRNTRALLAQGAIEYGRAHYPLIVAMHVAWLGALLIFVPRETEPSWPWAWVYIALQGVRAWTIVSLRPYWTTRVLTLPQRPLVARGPYRVMRHPNYAVVAAEIAVLPLVFGAWPIAVWFSLANAAVLTWRIRVEDRALAPRRTL